MTSLSNAGGRGSILSWEVKIPHACGQKKKKYKAQNRSNTVTNSIKTFKMVYIKKNPKIFLP